MKSIYDGKELWGRLTDEEKNEYLKKSHKLVLAYKYKKMIYKKKIKKMLPKRPLNAFLIFIKEKKGIKIPKGENVINYWRPIFDNLPKNKKEKYEGKAKIQKEEYEKKMDEFKNFVFDMPKKRLSSFALFVQDAIPKLKKIKEYKNLTLYEIIKRCAIIWGKSDAEFRKIFEENSAVDTKRFKIEMKQFEKFGYYKKSIYQEEDNKDKKISNKECQEEDKEIIIKRKITKKRSVCINKTKRGYKRKKSQRKTKKK